MADPQAAPRLFVALPVPEPVTQALAARLAAWRDGPGADLGRALRWTRPAGWHLTLAFLGDTPHDRVEAVIDRVGDALATTPLPDRLALEQPGRFGGQVLWLGVRDEPTGTAAALGATIQASLAAEHLPVTRRAVTPHVTLARARRGGRVTEATVAALAEHELPRDGWRPDAVHVVASELGDGPARYRTVARVLPPADDPRRRSDPGPPSGP